MSIGKQFLSGFGAILSIILIGSFIMFMTLSQIEKNQETVFDVTANQVQVLYDLKSNLVFQAFFANSILVEDTPEDRESLKKYAKNLDTELENLLKVEGAEKSKELNGFKKENEAFNKAFPALFVALDKGLIDEARNIVQKELQPKNERMLEYVITMNEQQNKNLETIQEKTSDSIATAKIVLMIKIALALFIAVGFFGVIRRTIFKPLAELMSFSNQIKEGDLTGPNLKIRSKDEISQLGEVMNETKGNLQSLIRSIQEGSERLTSASEDLSASTQEITASSDEISVQVEETFTMVKNASMSSSESAVAMEETAQGVGRIAESAQSLLNSSIDASEKAIHGNAEVDEAKSQMAVIEATTTTVSNLVQNLEGQIQEIQNITAVIADITDQTNLLALNAAIEAARAGEHGKGFAVVADEVRKLAEGSKKSAASISSLVQSIQKDSQAVVTAVNESISSVQDGVVVMNEAGHSFVSILESVEDMKHQIQEVSATAEELSASAEQVTASVEEIASGAEQASKSVNAISDTILEQNSTLQEVSAIAGNLVGQATELESIVHRFKV